MKNLFNDISQDEKNRILEMHSGKKNILSEDSEPTTNVMGTPNFKSKFGIKYTHTIPGDLTYTYGKCNGKWFAHNLKTTKEWDLSSNTKWKSSVDDLNKRFPNATNGCLKSVPA
jgi:hypothetical protein